MKPSPSLLANLDCEARWAGVTLPARVLAKISALAALTAALVDGDAEVWAPAAVDPSRFRVLRPAMRVGVPPNYDLAWADPAAKAANDRRLALAIAPFLDAREIREVAELTIAGAWVAKAPWTSAGRDRCHGRGAPTGETRIHLERLLARFGALVVEPWVERVADAGTCASVAPDGAVAVEASHTLVTDPRGGFAGIDLAPPAMTAAELAAIAEAARVAGAALHRLGYAGPFAIDSFVHAPRELRPIVEINARYTFGHVARALGRRLGIRRLGFGPPPAGAEVLIAPTAEDPTTAWVAA